MLATRVNNITGLAIDTKTETMATSSDYLKLADETKDVILEYAVQDWPVVKNSNGVEVSTHQCSNAPVKTYRAVGMVDAPPAKTFEYVIPGPRRLKWDKTIKWSEVVKEVNENTVVHRTLINSAAKGLISSREYLDLVTYYRDYEGGLYFTCGTGIDYNYPEDPKIVRGMNYPSGVLCFPVDGQPDKTKVVYIIQTDLKGRLPMKLIESVLPSNQLSFFSSIRKAIKDGILDK